MPVFGLVAAGPYDEAILSTLVRRIRPDVTSVLPRLCLSDAQVTTKFHSFLKDFQRANRGLPVDKAIVVRDSHAGRAQHVLERLRSGFGEGRYAFPVRFAVVQPAPEAWLLADHKALAQLSKERGRATDFPARDRSPEQLPDPKGRLRSVLATASVPYTKEAAARLAELCDLALVEALCNSFTSFKNAVTDC